MPLFLPPPQNYINCIDQVKLYIFVVDNFLIAVHAFEICASKDKQRKWRDAEKRECLLSLRLSLWLPTLKGAYLESVKSYQKVVNYRNKDLDLIYTTI